MPRIPDEAIERVKEASNIVEIVSEHVQLTRRGSGNFFGLCPFHQEKTPSFSVNADRQIYHCFGCGAGGNVFRFLQEIEHISFVEAVQFLAGRVGIALPASGGSPEHVSALDELYRANELAQKYFHHVLRNDPRAGKALEYLYARGLDDATIEGFGIGCAPPGWDNLLQVAGQRGLRAEVMVKAGLVQPRQGRAGHYDRFRDRITFPIASTSGRVVGFGARALRPDDQPKYLNSPETPIYHKSSILYGLHRTRGAIRETGVALVVEGYMDLLSLHQHGITHVVASSGTALTTEQCRILARTAPRVVLVFDGDAAGSTAAMRGAEVLVGAGLEAGVVSLPAEHDPDTFVRTEGPEAFRVLMQHAQTVLEFYLQQISAEHDLTTMQGRTRAMEKFKPLLLKTADLVRRDLLIKEVSQRLGIDEQAVRQQLAQEARRHRPREARSTGQPPAQIPAPPRPEKAFLGLLLQHPRFIDASSKRMTPDAFADPRCRELAALLFDEYRQAKEIDLPLLMNRLGNESLVQLVSDCAMLGFDQSQVERQWQDHLLYFSLQHLNRAMALARTALQKAVARGDEATTTAINQRLAELNRERVALAAKQNS